MINFPLYFFFGQCTVHTHFRIFYYNHRYVCVYVSVLRPYVYMYVMYMYVMYVCIHVYVYTCIMCVYMYVCMCVYMYVCMGGCNVCMYVLYVCMYLLFIMLRTSFHISVLDCGTSSIKTIINTRHTQ